MKRILFILSFILFLTGCAGKREINDLAIVMAVGIDKADDGQVEITVQVVRPADSRGQTGAPSGQTGDPIWAASSTGQTLFEAIRNLSTFSSRRVFWAHNYAIVISEDYAKEGIQEVVDFFTRNPELRMRTWVMVTPEKASEIVSTLSGIEVIPGEAINKLFRYTGVSVQAPRTQMIDLQAALADKSTEPVVARVQFINKGVSNKKPGQAGSIKQIELAGAGVFKGEKMVSVIEPKEMKGLLPFIEKPETGMMVLVCPDDEKKKISLELVNQRFKVTPNVRENQPVFTVDYSVIGSLVESPCAFTIKNTSQMKDLEKQVEAQLKNHVERVVKIAQSETKSDFLHLGEIFHNQFPVEWRKLEKNWEIVFPDVLVEVKTTAEINDSSLLFKPAKK
ncbi:Ger(x)C family spore germination protein [Mesobacillus maritimus]|uniref:Ger(x)C family spore germination protein n=1 Tax=Mesobacillus maritimus TaxID=1643336 RepID=UPI00384F523A